MYLLIPTPNLFQTRNLEYSTLFQISTASNGLIQKHKLFLLLIPVLVRTFWPLAKPQIQTGRQGILN